MSSSSSSSPPSDTPKPTVTELLSQSPEQIATFLGGIYEHSAWVADSLSKFPSDKIQSIQTVTQLASTMKQIVNDASQDQKLTLLKAHPDLCEKVAAIKELTPESQEEQSRAGLQTLTEQELQEFTTNNNLYKEKFKFPFILAVRNATKYTVLSALAGRVHHAAQQEFQIALEQVHKIAWMRLLSKLNLSTCQGFLTCHVLDTANGCPAANMRITLHKFTNNNDGNRELIGTYITNHDGRLDGGPALKNETFQVGSYEWTFYTADYFASKGTFTSGTPFLDTIPIRFGIDNPDDHYHVPLLVSPWSFSTYRGS